jgi:hypothetical protein
MESFSPVVHLPFASVMACLKDMKKPQSSKTAA